MRLWTNASVAAVVVFGGCGQGQAVGIATRRDSAGITIVQNVRPDRPTARQVTLQFRLGGKPSGPESFYALYPWQVAVSTTGVIGILNRQAYQVSTFDAHGAPMATYGQKGGGPGEFRYPSSVAVEPDGEVLVYDFGKQSLVPFAADGTPLEQRRLTVPFYGVRMVAGEKGLVLLSEDRRGSAGETTSRVLFLSPNDTVQLGLETRSSFKPVDYQSCGVSMHQSPLFAPSLVWGSNGSRTAIAAGPGYSIWVFDDTTLVQVVRRNMRPEKVTEEVARREVGEGEHWEIGGRECLVPADEVIKERGYAATVPIVEALAVTPTGGLWVKRRNPGSEVRSVDLFGSDGQYIGTVEPSPPFPTSFLPDGNLLSIEKDSLDVQTVAVYGVRDEGT